MGAVVVCGGVGSRGTMTNRAAVTGRADRVVNGLVLKQSFNSDTEHFAGIGQMAYSSLKLFGESAEAQEGIAAFNEKRKPEFAAYRTH